MKSNNTNILLAAGLILMAAVTRIVNTEMHIYNLAPVAAIGLFSGAVLKDKRFAYIMPLMAMFIADAYFQLFTKVNGFYGISQLFVYGAMALVTLLGTKMGQPKALKVAGYSVAGSAIFFIVSNFGTFADGTWGTGWNALVTTYAMALPFYKSEMATNFFFGTFVGDLIFSGVLFAAYQSLVKAMSTKVQQA